ncbi:molybdenum cofactor biosynthesis protein B [Kroppenstedtia eburnea]|uniref:Molybdopterin adenylyltransferase n=1 Tax=Kroppenstedtia eburnea TaxID=714067 RepID=A0A1N7P3I7_9BACL|nr:MogA/MoaB family molybdenum cofactor biosynthesis protein [Kroppenstedtia eburnea]EGK09125.1 molybdopterin biosynthesis mog protein [Desmospora sp. 8437]QKI80871.1 MogA/MoaB family molybdenum cofactor biosynthesis protein [Kroppenstedtia eburnea]SIT05152.1 molybdopterin adenylyltransferase [Kroppenstedtia eburnea]
MWRVGIVTASDKGARGEREDRSGEEIRRLLREPDFEVSAWEVVPDEQGRIKEVLIRMADTERLDLVLTTGGTGLAPRDVTPEATRDVIGREVPGIPEAMRLASLRKTPFGMLSRGVAGLRGKTLIINLPGSPKAVRECLEAVLPVLPHALETMTGEFGDHGESLSFKRKS